MTFRTELFIMTLSLVGEPRPPWIAARLFLLSGETCFQESPGTWLLDCSRHLIESDAVMAEKTDAPTEGGAGALSHHIAEKADKIKYLVLAVVVVLVAALIIFNYQRRAAANRKAEAGNKVFQAIIDVRSTPDSDAVALFRAGADEYAGLPAGAQARLLEFAFAYNTGKYAEAESAAKAFIRDYPSSSLVNRAKMALGQSLLMQDKLTEAISTFRALSATADPEVLPGAKLGLAQSLERDAEAVKDDTEEYHRRLGLAEEEYNDIIARSRITIAAQRGFWPQAVVLPADYALVLIKDKQAGHEPGIPSSMVPAPGPAEVPATLPMPTESPAVPETPAEPEVVAPEAPAGNAEPAASSENGESPAPAEIDEGGESENVEAENAAVEEAK